MRSYFLFTDVLTLLVVLSFYAYTEALHKWGLRMKKLMLIIASAMALVGCNSSSGDMVVHKSFKLWAEDGSQILLKQGQSYGVIVTPYSFFGSDFLAGFVSQDGTNEGVAKFDFLGFPEIPLNGEFEISERRIRVQEVSLKGKSEFVPYDTSVVEYSETCDDNQSQRLIKTQIRKGYRKVYVQVMNPSQTEVLAEFSFDNKYTEKTTLAQGECQ